jgi:outer membrane lipase/esterase
VAAFEGYAAAAKLTAKTINGALFTLDIGANDIFNALPSPSTAVGVVEAAAASAAADIEQLHKDGARSFLFYEVPNLGLTPDITAQGSKAQMFASTLAQLFNTTVLDLLKSSEAGEDPLKLIALDMYDNLTPDRDGSEPRRLRQCHGPLLDREL